MFLHENENKTFLDLCKYRNINFIVDDNKLIFDNYRDMFKALQLLWDIGISYKQEKRTVTIDKKYLEEKIIKLDNGKWQVQSEDGSKNLGTYDTKKEAEKRLQQVHYFKHMNETFGGFHPNFSNAAIIHKDGTVVYFDDENENVCREDGDITYFDNHPTTILNKIPTAKQYDKLVEVIDYCLRADGWAKIVVNPIGNTDISKDRTYHTIFTEYPDYKLADLDEFSYAHSLDGYDIISDIHIDGEKAVAHLKQVLGTSDSETVDYFENLKEELDIDKIKPDHSLTIIHQDGSVDYLPTTFDWDHKVTGKDILYFNDASKTIRIQETPTEEQYLELVKLIRYVLSEFHYLNILDDDYRLEKHIPEYDQYEYKLDAEEEVDKIRKILGVNDIGTVDYFESLNESLLIEKTRNQLIDKSKKSDNYSKNNQNKGKNRWERRLHSRIANRVSDYNTIDMDAFFKADILDFIIKVQGETNNYDVQITFENALREIQREVKKNQNKLEFRCVLRGLINQFNHGDVYVSCSCLHPDTKIKLLDGTTPTVAEMKQRFDRGEQLYVYSTDSKGDFKPGIVEKVWITKKENNLIKVTLDNGESIITTLDHPYMLRDGSYKLAEDLVVGQSLMPMYFNYGANGYELVKFNSEQRGWHSVYKLIADYFKADEIEEAKSRVSSDDNMPYDVAIHHKDFNKRNNNPENLQIMTAREHWNYHNSLKWENKPETVKENIRRTSHENAIKRNANPTEKMLECRRIFIEKGHQSAQFRNHDPECLKKQADLMRQTMKDYYNNISEETLINIKNKRRLGIKKAFERGCFKTEKFIQARHNAFKQERTPEFKLYQQRCKIGKIIQKILDASETPSPATYEKYRTKGYPKFTSGFKTWDELTKYFSLNHKIVAIEHIILDKPIDVYDIKVKDWENFVVNSGVVLHNCPDWKYRQDYWATKDQYNSGMPQPSNGKWLANPGDTKGAGCKHVNLVLSNLDWLMKIASVINNYIYWARDNLEWQYSKFIFPTIYGIPYEKAIQMTLDMYDDQGELKKDYADDTLKTDPAIINMSNMMGRIRGQYKKKPEPSVNPRFADIHPAKKEEPEDDQLSLDLEFGDDEEKEIIPED